MRAVTQPASSPPPGHPDGFFLERVTINHMQLETTGARTSLSLTATAGWSSVLWQRADMKHPDNNYSYFSVPYGAKLELLLIQGLHSPND